MPNSYSELHSLIFDIDRIPYAIAAILFTIVIGMITGPRHGNAYPFVWACVDFMFGWIGQRLDRLQRKKADLLFRGFLVTTMAVLIAAVLSEVAKVLIVAYPLSGFTQVLMISVCITSGTIWFILLQFYFALEKNSVSKGAIYSMARTCRSDLNSTDDFGMTRIGMGLAARSFDKGLVAPILWYLIGGFTAMFVYAFLAGLAWRFGKNGFTKGFGLVALALEKLLGIVPSFFAAVLMTIASTFTPTAGLVKSLSSWFGSKGSAPYEQGGYPLTAMAWALNVSLGGPFKDLNGSTNQNAWVGPEDATAKIDHHHLRRAIYINVTAHLLFVITLLVAYVWGSQFG